MASRLRKAQRKPLKPAQRLLLEPKKATGKSVHCSLLTWDKVIRRNESPCYLERKAEGTEVVSKHLDRQTQRTNAGRQQASQSGDPTACKLGVCTHVPLHQQWHATLASPHTLNDKLFGLEMHREELLVGSLSCPRTTG